MTRPQLSPLISNQSLSRILQILSCLFWVSSFIYPNETHMHPIESSLSRSIVGLVCNYCIMKYFNGDVDLRDRKTYGMVTYRSVSNTMQGMFTAFLMFYLPMPIIHTIAASSAIFTAGIQHYFFNIKLSARSRWLILVSILGVMLHANGQYITNFLHSTQSQSSDFHRYSEFKNYQYITIWQSVGLTVLFLISVIVWSLGLVFVKHIKLAPYQVNVHNNLILLFVTGFGYFFLPEEKKSQISTLLLSLLGCGLILFLAQISFVMALQLCSSVGIIMVLNTANIFIAYGYSLIRYNQQIDIISVAGMAITLACIIFVISDRYK